MVLGYDGSPESAAAVARAGELLRAREAVVAHVWSGLSGLLPHAPLAGPPSEAIAEGGELVEEGARERAVSCAQEGVELARAAGFDAHPELLAHQRNVWWTLKDYAERHAASVVVVGARGRSRLAGVLLGSVSSGLVHHAPAPVLVVPDAEGGESGQTVVFCDDGSTNARHAIHRGGALLQGPGAVLTLWHSWAANVPYIPVGAAAIAGMAQELDTAAREQAARIATEGAQSARAVVGDVEGESIRCARPAWRGLLDAATDRDAAVIVVGSRGLTGIEGAIGSTSRAIVQHSSRPVLIVPAGDEPPASS